MHRVTKRLSCCDRETGGSWMDVDRRGFIIAAGIMALAPLAAMMKRWQPAVNAAAPVFRPAPLVGGGNVCARCGGDDHTALDPRCPESSGARTALQASARRNAAATRGSVT